MNVHLEVYAFGRVGPQHML